MSPASKHVRSAWIGFTGLLLCMGFFWFVTYKSSAANVTVDLREFHVDIADTDATRELGLGGRESLERNEGMLFLFGKPAIYPFWMKGMKIPLDIIWLKEGVVVDVATLNPPKDEKAIPAWHLPIRSADMVLEVRAGTAGRLGIERGVRLQLPTGTD